MTYNRCVGTKYCANNCPYKVRRFNFLEFTAAKREPESLVYNPEVTVRPRASWRSAASACSGSRTAACAQCQRTAP